MVSNNINFNHDYHQPSTIILIALVQEKVTTITEMYYINLKHF